MALITCDGWNSKWPGATCPHPAKYIVREVFSGQCQNTCARHLARTVDELSTEEPGTWLSVGLVL